MIPVWRPICATGAAGFLTRLPGGPTARASRSRREVGYGADLGGVSGAANVSWRLPPRGSDHAYVNRMPLSAAEIEVGFILDALPWNQFAASVQIFSVHERVGTVAVGLDETKATQVIP